MAPASQGPNLVKFSTVSFRKFTIECQMSLRHPIGKGHVEIFGGQWVRSYDTPNKVQSVVVG